MAGSDRVAGIYSEVKYRFDKKSLQTLRKFKNDMKELKGSLMAVQNLSKKKLGVGFDSNAAKVSTQVKKESVDTIKALGKQNKLRENSVKLQSSLARAKADESKKQALASAKALGAQNKLRENFNKEQAAAARKEAESVAKEAARRKKEELDSIRALGAQNKMREKSVRLQANLARKEALQRKVAENAARRARDLADRQAMNQAKLARIAQGSNGKVTTDALRKAQVEQAKYNQQLRQGVITMGHYNRASQDIARGLREQARAARETTFSFNKMRTAIASATGAYSAYAGMTGVGSIGGGFESAEIMLETAMGGEEAKRTMEFLVEQSKRLGIGAAESARGFARYALAGKQMGFSMEEMREQFLGITEAATVFGLRQDEITGVVRALEQMASKGTIQAEELKNQLGDRMPAVMSIAAKSMSMTTQELIKAMEQGEIAAKDFLPAFSKAMGEMAKPGLAKSFKTMNVAYKRMVQNGKLLVDAIFKSGIGDLFTQIMNTISDTFTIMQPIMSFLGGFLSSFLKAVIFPIRLAIALVADLVDLINYGLKEKFGTNLTEIFAFIGKAVGFLASLFTGIFNIVGKAVSWIGKALSKISPTVWFAKKVGAGPTIAEGFKKAGSVARAVGTHTQTKVG